MLSMTTTLRAVPSRARGASDVTPRAYGYDVHESAWACGDLVQISRRADYGAPARACNASRMWSRISS